VQSGVDTCQTARHGYPYPSCQLPRRGVRRLQSAAGCPLRAVRHPADNRTRPVAAAAQRSTAASTRLGQPLRRPGGWGDQPQLPGGAARQLPLGWRRTHLCRRCQRLGRGWPRCDAETSPERAIDSHASRHSAGQPIVAGWASSWIAQLSFARESWTAPLRVRRVRPQEHANVLAAEQIAAFLPHLPAEGPLPWFLVDAGSMPATIRSSSPKRWVRLTPPCWFVCARAAVSPLTRAHSHELDVPDVMGTHSPVMRPRRGPDVAHARWRSDRRGRAVRPWCACWCACGRGRGCTPSPRVSTPSAMRGDDLQLCAARCCSSRSAACLNGPASPRRSGSGGMAHQMSRSPTRGPRRRSRLARLRAAL
jgi:hypothetical protein